MLPARLGDAGNLALRSEFSEAQSTDAEFSDEGPWSAAHGATII